MESARPRTPFSTLAAVYERVAVPAMFAPEAEGLLALAALQPGERVLDVACGTGIVARLAAPRVGPRGTVVGLDRNGAMLAVARACPPVVGARITWLQGDACALPCAAGAFAVVLCQNGLQFLPDRPRALREMHRVLRPGGRLVLNVVAREAASQAVERAVAQFLGADALTLFREPFVLADPTELAALCAAAGFHAVQVTSQRVTARCPAVDDFVAFTLTVRLASVLERLPPSERQALHEAARQQLAPYLTADGLVFPIDMLVVYARC
ncbi:MAG TPA: methyltransferase domain-containing protein [Chloroflexota bacterium]|jgi:ubiquinone/menaquinone biosynthesis C-methylase UbiE|nr:methyltransferase domain-containing protein [Chloroflexota bacterium]